MVFVLGDMEARTLVLLACMGSTRFSGRFSKRLTVQSVMNKYSNF